MGALQVAAHKLKSPFFRCLPQIAVPDRNDQLWSKTQHRWVKYIDSIGEIYQSTAHQVRHILLEKQALPLVLAADHATAGATIAGIRMAYPDFRLGVVWIDAHADLHSPYTSPSGNVHGMPLAASLALDNKTNKRNEPAPDTLQHWERLKTLGGITPKIGPQDLAFIALRDTEPEEETIICRYGIPVYTVGEVREKGASWVANEINRQLQHCDLLYISFDVDSLDPELVSYGTGTPVHDGLAPWEAQQLLKGLLKNPRFTALEVAEINPALDNKCNRMAETVMEILDFTLADLGIYAPRHPALSAQ